MQCLQRGQKRELDALQLELWQLRAAVGIEPRSFAKQPVFLTATPFLQPTFVRVFKIGPSVVFESNNYFLGFHYITSTKEFSGNLHSVKT